MSPSPGPRPAGRRATFSSGIGPLVLAGTAGAATIAVLLVLLTQDPWWSVSGLPDPGELTRKGILVIRVLSTTAAVVCVGSLLLAAFLVPAKPTGRVDADGFAALRTAAVAASVWLVTSLAAVLFTAAEGIGIPPGELALSPRDFRTAVNALEQPKAWLVTSLLVLVLVVGCRIALSWRSTVGLFLVSLFALLPVAVTGHSAAGGSHDIATNSLIFHLVAATLWVGGLIAVLAAGYRRSRHLVLAVHRFSQLALVCWLVMAASGVLNALVRVESVDLLGTTYGRLMLLKAVALAMLGWVGYRHRRHTIRLLTWHENRRPLIRLAGVEVLIMLVTIGVAAALGRTPPPPRASALPSTTELLIGYDLAGPPTFGRLLFDWRFDLVFGTAALVLAVLYLLGVRRLRLRGTPWPVWRTVSWLAGCLVILLATSSGLARYAPAVFSLHMVSQLLLTVLAPVLLVLGGPVIVMLRAVRAGQPATPGPREWLTSLLRSRACRVLTRPGVSYALLVGPLYLLYFSGLFTSLVSYHWAHLAMNGYFLLAGYLFFWPVIGVDPAPRRLPAAGRVGMMFAMLPAFGFLAVVLSNMGTVLGEGFYWSLDLAWLTDPLAVQAFGGTTVWAFGELPVLVLLLVTVAQWARSDERDAVHASAGTGEAELEAYNAMLAQLEGVRSPDRAGEHSRDQPRR
jgi:cytochrome c oxidase assembly factor CtaG/putative copper export protein